MYKSESASKYQYKDRSMGTSYKKSITCCHCGKMGHVSRDCRTRLANEKVTPPLQTPVASATPSPQTTYKPEKRQVVCFVCHQQGHKSPQCPKKIAAVKRIQIPITKVVSLKMNEVFGRVEGHFLPITCDSGADITVVPEECVGPEQLTGESCTVTTFNRTKTVGKECIVTVQVGDREFPRMAVTQPWEEIFWTACLSFDLSNREETRFLGDQIDKKKDLEEEEVSYLPPRMECGTFHPAVVVSEGTLVGVGDNAPPVVTLESDPQSEEEKTEVVHT